MLTGKNPLQVTSSTRNLVPNWFPDGEQIAFVSIVIIISACGLLPCKAEETISSSILDGIYNTRDCRPMVKQLAFNLTDQGIINI